MSSVFVFVKLYSRELTGNEWKEMVDLWSNSNQGSWDYMVSVLNPSFSRAAQNVFLLTFMAKSEPVFVGGEG